MPLSAFALEIYQNLIANLSNAKHGEKEQLIQKVIKTLGVSRNQVYRELKELGHESGRKVRADKGLCKVPDNEIITVANLLHQSTRANGKQLLTISDAKRIAMTNGLLNTNISDSRLAVVMRDIGVHPEQLAQPRAYISTKTEFPNQEWQIDASTCVVYYMHNGKLGVIDERRFNDKKPRNMSRISDKRITRYIATDHYSGAFYVEYLRGVEDSSNFFNFFFNAMARREGKPFFGVPHHLYFDAASAHQAKTSKSFLDWLGIKYKHHLPNNAQATGSVEGAQNIVERHFEGRLFMTELRSFEQLNLAAHEWMHAFQSDPKMNVHSRHGHTRYAMWSTIAPQYLRLCPPLEKCQAAIRGTTETRKVHPELKVEFGGNEYSVRDIQEIRVGDSIIVTTNPYRDDCVIAVITARDGIETQYECPLIKRDFAGFREDAPVKFKEYKSVPETNTEKLRKEMRKQAYDTTSIIEADKKRQQKVPAFKGINPFADVEQANIPEHLPRKGTMLETKDSRIQLPKMNQVQLRIALKDKLGRSATKEELEFINKLYPSATAMDIDTIVSKLSVKAGMYVVKAANS